MGVCIPPPPHPSWDDMVHFLKFVCLTVVHLLPSGTTPPRKNPGSIPECSCTKAADSDFYLIRRASIAKNDIFKLYFGP